MLVILQSLLSANDQVRRNAEAEFDNNLRTVPDAVLVGLTQVMASPETDSTLRSLAIVLLRRVLVRQHELWMEHVTNETRRKIQWDLLALLDSPAFSDRSMRKKLCDTISIVAVMTFDAEQEWPELVPHMFRAVSTPSATSIQKENALSLFTNLAEYIHEKFEKEFARIAGILNALGSPTEPNLDVRLAAIRAAWCLVEVYNQDDEDGNVVAPFKQLVGTRLTVIHDAIVANHPKCAEPLEDLIDLAGSQHSRLLAKKDIERGVQMMIELASVSHQPGSQSGARSSLRLLALEFIVTLMETRGAVIRKIKPPENAVLHSVLPIVIKLMMELPDLNEKQLRSWGARYPANACSATASQHVDDEDDCADFSIDFDAFGASLEYVDRIARAMKPKHVLPVIFAAASELLQQKEASWKFAHSALLTLAHVVEFVDRKEPQLGELCRTAGLYGTEHPHMRVRHAAFTLIARLAFDCAPNTQKRHSQVIVAACLHGIADPVPRVQAHAAIALINYCAACQDHDEYESGLKPYLGDVVNKLFAVLQASPQIVQENIISALASVARTAEKDFLPFYESLPILRSALERLNAPSEYSLKARIFDCIAIIGQSVGKEKFIHDAPWFIAYLQATPLISDDANVQHIQAAWMALGEVLGPDIGPSLDKIVPFTLEMANKPIHDDDEDDLEDDDEEGEKDRDELVAMEMVRTAAVDDRLLALELLCSFASHTQKAFFPYLEPTLAVFFRDVRIENCHNDDIRGRIAQGFPDMIRCAIACTSAGLLPADLFQKILVQSLEVICVATNAEDTMDNLHIMVRAVMEMLNLVHDLVVSSGQDACPDYVEPCAAVLVQLLRDSIQRRALEYSTMQCDKAEDEIDEEAQEDYEAKVMTEHELHSLLSAAIGALIKSNPNSFIPLAFTSDAVGPHIFDLAHHIRLCHDQMIAVFILDDVIEHASMASMTPELLNKITSLLITAVKIEKSTSQTETSTEVAGLVQAASYGLGICAVKYGNQWPGAGLAAKELILVLRKAPKDLRHQDNSYGSCLDNCASALMKIARNSPQALAAGGSGVTPEAALQTWLEYFPLESDLEESRMNSFALLQMVQEDRVPFLLDQKTLPVVVRSFAAVIGTEYMADAHVDRAIQLLEDLKTQIGPQAFSAIAATIPKEHLQRMAEASHHG